MKYRVFNKITGEDITDNEPWVVTPDGRLFYLDYDSLTGDPNAIYIPEVEAIISEKDYLIPMSNLKKGNTFEKDGRILVVIDDACDGYVWVTTPYYDAENGWYSYTSAALVEVEDVDVRLIEG